MGLQVEHDDSGEHGEPPDPLVELPLSGSCKWWRIKRARSTQGQLEVEYLNTMQVFERVLHDDANSMGGYVEEQRVSSKQVGDKEFRRGSKYEGLHAFQQRHRWNL